MRTVQLKKYLYFNLIVVSLILLFGMVVYSGKVSALSGSEFRAGNIIDNSVFYNSTSMTSQQIQNFLNSKVPSCDTNGQKIYSGSTTRAQYGASRGYPAPYTCLKVYSQNVPSVVNSGSDLCKRSISGGVKSAASIIYEVSQACGINPQVLIVLLQKEQSLITDDWPWSIQYRSATGYGCPDTAPCDSEFYGFFNQVYQAAKAFKRYEANPTLFNYRANRNNYIQYNPNPACGGSNVFIENQATANLYIYTPYQPNQSAINNLYGSGDSCGAYGNRNFWRMFNDWFGSTRGPSFSAAYSSQSPSFSTLAGETKAVQMSFKNTGNTFWKDDISKFAGYPPVKLATSSVINRVSDFRSTNWQSGNRPSGVFSKVYKADGVTLTGDQRTVNPGEIVRFDFSLTIPSDTKPGLYREYFQPVLEGSASWNLGTEAWIEINVLPTSYSAAFVSQSAYPTIVQGNTKNAFLRYRNSGNATWYNNTSAPARVSPISLATTWPINRTSIMANNTWAGSSRPARSFSKVYESNGTTLSLNQTKVNPGQIAEFSYTLTANYSTSPGQYREYFQPIPEGSSKWDMGGVSYQDIDIQTEIFKANYVSQSTYPTIKKGTAKLVYFRFKNSGNMFWKDDSSSFSGYPPVTLAATNPINRISNLRHSGLWQSSNRPNREFTKVYESNGTTLSTDQNTVQPGQIVEYQLYFYVNPSTPSGTYREYFQPIREGSANWDLGVKAYLDVTVID